MFKNIKHFKNKELFIALYFLVFIFGISLNLSSNFYNEARIFEILLLLVFGFYSVFKKENKIGIYDFLFIIFLIVFYLFKDNSTYIIFELLLFYLLYKIFFVLNYNSEISKVSLFFGFFVFLMLPFSVLNYINTGFYNNWYPMPWNIRVYNSYFLVLSIFSVWFYLKEEKFKNIYLFFIFLAFLSILLDGGRSAALAYSMFVAGICIFNRAIRFKLLFTYCFTCLIYLLIMYSSSHFSSGVISIVRETTSGRYELWINALQCWLQSPLFGCGFYQLDQYSGLPAHPHNLFLQVLTETGLVGFSFLSYIIFTILRNISWNFKENYFVISAFIAVTIELSFSGIHVYPVTQVALLWLFIFLLKNPEFPHVNRFNSVSSSNASLSQYFGFVIYFVITLIFVYLFFNATAQFENLPSTPPRFWEYGYKLF